eukprot:SAG11_NODE_22116_length_411_cov_688.041667_1_plen_84_part_00
MSANQTKSAVVKGYLKDKYITQKQFDKLSDNHLKQIGSWNKKKKHKPQPSIPGKKNKDFNKKGRKNKNYDSSLPSGKGTGLKT